MNLTRFFLGCLVTCLILACGQNKPVPNIPDKKSGFARTVFTAETQSGSTITLISETECELNLNDGLIRLAEYSRQDNKLRLVIREGGTAAVLYFDIVPQGLRASETGVLYLLPEAIIKAQ